MFFIDYVFLADHEHVFWRMPAYSTYSKYDIAFFLHIMKCFIGHGKICFAIYMHILHIFSTWKTRDGRKFAKNFGVLGVSGLNK